MVFGHYTVKLKSVVINPRNIVVARDVYVNGYDGGGGHSYWTCDTSDKRLYNEQQLEGRDIFVIAVPPDWEPNDYIMDLTGFFNQDACNDGRIECYPERIANAYTTFWGWRQSDDVLHQGYEHSEMPLCFKAHSATSSIVDKAQDHGINGCCARDI
jgi:hypothetical protein